jgi:hypothetical protein
MRDFLALRGSDQQGLRRLKRSARQSRLRSSVGAVCQELERRLFFSTTFTIDPSQSSATISGTLAGVALVAQQTGSLTDSFSGGITADLTDTTVQFDSATIMGTATGAFLPGSTSADFAGMVTTFLGTGYAAIRGLGLNLNSGALTLSGDAVDQGSASVSLAAGSKLDTSVASNLHMTGALTVPSGTDATIVTNNGVTTLTLTVNYTYTHTLLTTNDTSLTLTGTIVATYTAPPPVSAVENGPVLTVTGTALGDTIGLDMNGPDVEVTSSGVPINGSPFASVTSVVVDAGTGADTITVGAGVPATDVEGQGGADTITAANSAADTLNGGGGSDSIQAGSGADLIDGGGGNNAIVGGPGDNTIIGGTSFNGTTGTPFNDTIIGGTGAESIFGGGATDKIILGVHDVMPGNDNTLGDVDFTAGSPSQEGVGVIGSSTDVWTDVSSPSFQLNQPPLVIGPQPIGLAGDFDVPTGYTVKGTARLATHDPSGSPEFHGTALANLMDAYLIADPTESYLNEPQPGGSKIKLVGLDENTIFNVYLISSADTNGRTTEFTVNGVEQNCVYSSLATTLIDGENYVVFTVNTGMSNKIVIGYDAPTNMEGDLNGIQIEQANAIP